MTNTKRAVTLLRPRASSPLLCAAIMVALISAGCATEDPGAQSDPAPSATADPEAPDPSTDADAASVREVFFATVEDGGTYSSPVEFIFTVNAFAIVPIEDPLVVRPGEGHYHLAVDAECAAAGEVIVAGNPSYIHFGSGNDNIQMQFEPGVHRLCLQVADGEHRVIDGPDHSLLSKEIQITIE